MIIVKLHETLLMHANWPKLCPHTVQYFFQAFSSQNHAPFKRAQDCCKLNFFLWVLLIYLPVHLAMFAIHLMISAIHFMSGLCKALHSIIAPKKFRQLGKGV